MAETTYIKQYGLKRTGTNLVKYLIEENFRDVRVLINIAGWKHGPYSPEVDWSGADWDRDIDKGTTIGSISPEELARIRSAHVNGSLYYFASTKNPYSWLSSYFKFRKKRGEVEAEALRSSAPELLANDIDLYVSTHQSYLRMVEEQPTRAAIFRYEDFLSDFLGTMLRLKDFYGLENKTDYYNRPRLKMGRGNDRIPHEYLTRYPESGEEFDGGYYLNHLYIENFAPEQLELIRERLPETLLEKLGYPIL